MANVNADYKLSVIDEIETKELLDQRDEAVLTGLSKDNNWK